MMLSSGFYHKMDFHRVGHGITKELSECGTMSTMHVQGSQVVINEDPINLHKSSWYSKRSTKQECLSVKAHLPLASRNSNTYNLTLK